SMGGAAGVGLAARHPYLVRALVLVDPALPRPAGNRAQWALMARLAPTIVPQLGSRVLALRGRMLGPERLVDQMLEWTLCQPDRLGPPLPRPLVGFARAGLGFPATPAAAECS